MTSIHYDSASPSNTHGMFAHPSLYSTQSHSPLPFLPCWFFACLPRQPALPEDSLICLPFVAFLIAWSPDKEKQ